MAARSGEGSGDEEGGGGGERGWCGAAARWASLRLPAVLCRPARHRRALCCESERHLLRSPSLRLFDPLAQRSHGHAGCPWKQWYYCGAYAAPAHPRQSTRACIAHGPACSLRLPVLVRSLAGSRRQLEAFRPFRLLAIECVAFSRSSTQTALQRPLHTLGNWLRNCSFSFSVQQNPRIYAHMSTTQRMQSPPCTASERERQERARGGGRARGRGRGRTVVEALRDLVERGLQGEEAPSVPA